MGALYGIAGDILDRLEGELTGKTICGTSNREYSKVLTLKFSRAELLYDIKNIAFVESDVVPTEDEHDRHQIADIGEDGNVDRVTRVMDLAICHCTELLYPFSKTTIEEEAERDDVLKETGEYRIVMHVPDDFSKSTADYLVKLIHDFVVYAVLADWMSITNLKNQNSAVNWAAKKQEIEDEITSALNARMRRVRRPLTPF